MRLFPVRRREFRYWRSMCGVTSATDGNPLVWLRFGPVGFGVGRLDGSGLLHPIWWLSK